MRKERTRKMNRKIISQGIVAKRIRKESFTCLKQVVALEGYHDDGKTSVIKTLIGELYRRDPKSWRRWRWNGYCPLSQRRKDERC